ncbi:cupin domain-containing protein [Devosia riboflavina]
MRKRQRAGTSSKGTFDFHIGDETFEAGPGTFVSVDAGQAHGFNNKTDGKLLVIFNPGGYEQFFADWAEQGLERGPALGALEEHIWRDATAAPMT